MSAPGRPATDSGPVPARGRLPATPQIAAKTSTTATGTATAVRRARLRPRARICSGAGQLTPARSAASRPGEQPRLVVQQVGQDRVRVRLRWRLLHQRRQRLRQHVASRFRRQVHHRLVRRPTRLPARCRLRARSRSARRIRCRVGFRHPLHPRLRHQRPPPVRRRPTVRPAPPVPGQAGLDGADRGTRLPGHLGDRQTKQVVESQRGPLLLGQAAQRGHHVDGVGARSRRHVLHRAMTQVRPRPAANGPPPADRHPGGDHPYPGFRVLVAAHRRPALPGPDVRLLDRVLCLRQVTGQQVHVAEQPLPLAR